MLLPGEIPIDALDRGDVATGAPADRGYIDFADEDQSAPSVMAIVALLIIVATFAATLLF
ncbi:hypothetical protein [Caulobacter sp. X]|jgi:hypothetical protein|uniref:hypothetical protein n=1 Tax=Caulobacter sp. X TaxID=2048901 RepID=UPI000C148104|nr:hypothetical protein [Caulobacter sp. X]PIB95355.1 hypothetical protein CSW60_22690 [Caulobacter sp. X]